MRKKNKNQTKTVDYQEHIKKVKSFKTNYFFVFFTERLETDGP
jgi:hypothetical protein